MKLRECEKYVKSVYHPGNVGDWLNPFSKKKNNPLIKSIFHVSWQEESIMKLFPFSFFFTRESHLINCEHLQLFFFPFSVDYSNLSVSSAKVFCRSGRNFFVSLLILTLLA